MDDIEELTVQSADMTSRKFKPGPDIEELTVESVDMTSRSFKPGPEPGPAAKVPSDMEMTAVGHPKGEQLPMATGRTYALAAKKRTIRQQPNGSGGGGGSTILTEAELRKILEEHQAFELPHGSISHEELMEMGITEPAQRLLALRLLATSSALGRQFSRRQWAHSLTWEGHRRATLTLCSYFPLCCCYYLSRVLSNDIEDYILTPHSLILTTAHPVCARTKKLIIYLRTVVSIDVFEQDNVTGTRSLGGLKLMRSETLLIIRTEHGAKATLRLDRSTADETVDALLMKVRTARAIKSAVEVANSRLAATMLSARADSISLRRKQRRRSYFDFIEDALNDRTSTSYWVKQVILEFVETAVVCAVFPFEAKSQQDRKTDYNSALSLLIGAVIVNVVSLIPLLSVVSMYKLQRSMNRLNGSRGGREFPLPSGYESVLHLSRAAYFLLDIISDYLQFICSLYIVILQKDKSGASALISYEGLVSLFALVAMAMGTLEVHVEVRDWMGAIGCTGGNVCWFFSRSASLAFLGLGIYFYIEFMETTRREIMQVRRKNVQKCACVPIGCLLFCVFSFIEQDFTLYGGLLLFLYIGVFAIFAGTERWCLKLCGCYHRKVYDRRYADNLARDTPSGVRFARRDEPNNTLWVLFSQCVDMLTKFS